MAPAAMIGAMTDRNDDDNRYQPASAWRRILILVLAVVTTLVIVWALVTRPGHVPHVPLPRPNAPPCSAGQTQHCVGGQLDVLVLPRAAAAASGASAAPPPAQAER
jgi:hypothetical protein